MTSTTAPQKGASIDQWFSYIGATHTKTIDMTLDRPRAVLERLDIAPPCPIVTVGGTNGKGSTCAMLASLLHSAHYSVGLYTSPHLIRFNERIVLNDVPVTDEQLISVFEAIESARHETSLTYFEWATLAAFKLFSQHKLDIWILEVGMGGRLDATNLIDADVAIITTIDLDHQAYLGSTREAIGLEKLGIGRSSHPLILGDPSPPDTLLKAAHKQNINLIHIGHDYGYLADTPHQWQYWLRPPNAPLKQRFGLPWPALRGKHQLANAATTLTALHYLNDKLPLSMQSIRAGLLNVEWPGRFQVLPGQPVTVLDVAHNPHAMYALAANLDQMAFFPATWCIWGMLSDKDAFACAQILQPHVQKWVLCTLEGERARSAQELQELLKSLGVPATDITCFNRPTEAYAWTSKHAQPVDRIVVTGSFLTVADITHQRG